MHFFTFKNTSAVLVTLPRALVQTQLEILNPCTLQVVETLVMIHPPAPREATCAAKAVSNEYNDFMGVTNSMTPLE